MNKEVEEAKERIRKRIKDCEDYKLTQVWLTDDVWSAEVLLNYIQELEEDNNAYNEEEIALNNRIMDLEEAIQDAYRFLNKDENTEFNNKKLETILNYIQELEEHNKRLKDKCLDMATGKEYAENETIKELQESIHKERELAEAQTTYEVNEMWKEKIENKIEEIKKLNFNNNPNQKIVNYFQGKVDALQELLNQEE